MSTRHPSVEAALLAQLEQAAATPPGEDPPPPLVVWCNSCDEYELTAEGMELVAPGYRFLAH